MVQKNISIYFPIVVIIPIIYMSLYINFIRCFPSIIIDSSFPSILRNIHKSLMIHYFPVP